MKTQFLCVKPKSNEAQEFFDILMRQLHSCKVIDQEENRVLLNSIAGDYKFWMNIEGDKNWEIIR